MSIDIKFVLGTPEMESAFTNGQKPAGALVAFFSMEDRDGVTRQDVAKNFMERLTHYTEQVVNSISSNCYRPPTLTETMIMKRAAILAMQDTCKKYGNAWGVCVNASSLPTHEE